MVLAARRSRALPALDGRLAGAGRLLPVRRDLLRAGDAGGARAGAAVRAVGRDADRRHPGLRAARTRRGGVRAAVDAGARRRLRRGRGRRPRRPHRGRGLAVRRVAAGTAALSFELRGRRVSRLCRAAVARAVGVRRPGARAHIRARRLRPVATAPLRLSHAQPARRPVSVRSRRLRRPRPLLDRGDRRHDGRHGAGRSAAGGVFGAAPAGGRVPPDDRALERHRGRADRHARAQIPQPLRNADPGLGDGAPRPLGDGLRAPGRSRRHAGARAAP
jgi:hypothetical protein